MIIIGIDPGTATTGYGIIKAKSEKRKAKNDIKWIAHGCIKTNPDLSSPERLKEINKELNKIIKKYQPGLAGVESIFFFKNQKTAMRVSEVKGVILFTLEKLKIPIQEYTPLQVKKGICGYGRAEKIQLQKMIKTLLNLKEIPKPDDAADALAIAICCANSIKI